jgi:chromosomal replication initiation ATPase DnaA
MNLNSRNAPRLSSPASGATAGEDGSERLRERDKWGSYSISDIEAVVAARYGLSRDQMRAPDRRRALARPRQIAMFLAREMTGQSLPRIGMHFCRDHTTVIHAVRLITKLQAQDGRLAAEVEGCRELIARQKPWRAQMAATLAPQPGAP